MLSLSLNKYTLFLIVTFLLCSCKKFLDVGGPIDRVTADFVYSSDLSAVSVLSGIYFDMQEENSGFAQGRRGLSFSCSLSADELNVLPLSNYSAVYNNDEHADLWSRLYQYLYRVNSAIEGITQSERISLSVKRQLLGECKFLRAFCYFYLINLYGNVPLLLTTDYKVNAVATRTEKGKVYDQIIIDLLEAQSILNDYFVSSDSKSESDERIRPNKWAATALLARVYLYIGDWENSRKMSSLIIDNKSLFDILPLENVFVKNSKEAIWQLQTIDVYGDTKTQEATLYVLVNGVPDNYDNPAWIGTKLFDSFEDGDLRKKNWLNVDSSRIEKYYYPFKYKFISLGQSSTEYLMVFRVAEQYLIRAESFAQQGNISNAANDLNIIRFRAGLPATNAVNKEQMMAAILNERRIELFTEWGHRWFDLKRLGLIDKIMNQEVKLRPASWEPYKALWPIPISDINLNKNIVQNEGYPSI